VYSRLCIGILDAFECFLTSCGVGAACTNGCMGLVLLVLCMHIFYTVLCMVLLSTGMFWICVCVIVLCSDYIRC
jgi:hypothetical protein